MVVVVVLGASGTESTQSRARGSPLRHLAATPSAFLFSNHNSSLGEPLWFRAGATAD